MKHLDEGTLQAWLDMPRSGLDQSEVAEIERHLATCDACSSLLEELRGSDATVHGLLAGGVDRSVERPPFEAVVARAEEHRAAERGRRRGRGRLGRLAWAASIVVALGVGWMTNELYRSGPPNPTSTVPVAPARTRAGSGTVEAEMAVERPSPSTEAAPTSGAEAEVAARSGRAEETLRDAPVEPSVDAPPAVGDVDAAPAGAGQADAPVVEAAPAGVDADAVAPPAAVRQRALAADASRDALVAEPSDTFAAQAVPGLSVPPGQALVRGTVRDTEGRPVSSAQVFVERFNVGALSGDNGSYTLFIPDSALDSLPLALTVQRLGFGTETEEVRVGGDAVAVVDFTLEQQAVRLQEVVVTGQPAPAQRRALGNAVTSLTAAEVLRWQPATRDEAERALGNPLLIVPGLDIVSVESAEPDEADVGPLVRIRQALDGDGAVLTLVEGQDREDREGWNVVSEGERVSVRQDGLLITGTAPVSADTLRRMLDALR